VSLLPPEEIIERSTAPKLLVQLESAKVDPIPQVKNSVQIVVTLHSKRTNGDSSFKIRK
jgi:hypothetical protein